MSEAALAAEGICVVRERASIVQNVDLRAHHGEVLAVLGPNGAGKSTLLRAVAGLLPHTGRVLLSGHDAARLSVRERATRLTLVPQQTGLRVALPARAVVAQGRYAHGTALAGLGAADRDAIAGALARTDTAHLAQRAFTTLSFGEQRRVLIARGLATGARVLCLDEPTAGLDVRHALELYVLLRELAAQGHAVVVALHQLDDALRFADQALLLAAGVAVRSDVAPAVIVPDVIRAVYGVTMRPGASLGFALPEDP
ncbi:MAG: ABC transporter ATP-binding protein [bacterium]|nr:ABC transporter ATP-binding protein [bacterium]